MITTDSHHPLDYAIPFRIARAKIDSLDPKLADSLQKAREKKHGAVLYGPTGVGKSYAMTAVYRIAALAVAGKGDRSIEPLFVDWKEFVGDIERFKDWNRGAPDREKFDPARRLFTWRGPLFIDDVGQEQIVESGYMVNAYESLFDEFVNRRTALDQQLWLTTNLTPTELRKRYGERVFSRLVEHCIFLPVAGDDRRLIA